MLFLPNQKYEYKGFVTTIKYSSEDGVFCGSLENVRDYVCFDGNTVEQAYHYFVEAVENYMRMCKEFDKTIDFIESR